MTQARQQLQAHLDELSVTSRRHRGVLRLLREPATIADLVDATALSRRAIETLLRLAGPDLDRVGDTYRLVAAGYDELALPDDAPLAWTGREDPALADRLLPLIAAAPPPVKHLDHVPATPASVARRATWMADELWLPGATVAFIGDHDLTSVALALAVPDVRVVVVDLDTRLLEYLREVLPGAELHHLDLRDPLPAPLVGVADAFVTDPPYTPTGAALFVARGLTMLRGGPGAVHRRGLLAYGYGEQLPTLGLKVQRAVQDLEVVFEQVLPRFGRYVGAQAVGSASDWYVLAPTPRTARAVARFTVPDERIYTHGRQSLEAEPESAASPAAAADPADVLRARLAEHEASTVRAAAVTALAKALRAAGERPSKAQVRDLVAGVLAPAGSTVPDGETAPDGDERLGALDPAARAAVASALVALLPPSSGRPGPA
ncbi:MAG: bis-aminopropyl spermidine synthase family protein [Cellulomonas sp.]|nr:bis-aminopropyl spermidine synthase family protein [Cellulomonas sp.]